MYSLHYSYSYSILNFLSSHTPGHLPPPPPSWGSLEALGYAVPCSVANRMLVRGGGLALRYAVPVLAVLHSEAPCYVAMLPCCYGDVFPQEQVVTCEPGREGWDPTHQLEYTSNHARPLQPDHAPSPMPRPFTRYASSTTTASPPQAPEPSTRKQRFTPPPPPPPRQLYIYLVNRSINTNCVLMCSGLLWCSS